MYFNFFINKLFLLIFMFFSYNYSIFANNLFNHKEGIYSEYKKVLYLKNNIKNLTIKIIKNNIIAIKKIKKNRKKI